MFRLPVSVAALALLTAPAFATDTCTFGNYEADPDDMAHIMGLTMGATVVHAGGSVFMQITGTDEYWIHADNISFFVQAPGQPAIEVTVSGDAEGTVDFTPGSAGSGGTFSLVNTSYTLTASADILGSIMTFPIPPGFMGSASGLYGCSDDSLRFESYGTSDIPRDWRRI